MPPDDDFLDHPEHMRDGAVDDETAELLPLFPDGDPAKAAEWRELFGGA